MKIDIFISPRDIQSLREKTTVVFDVLRATSIIITVLANKCQAVIPVLEVNEAYETFNRLTINGQLVKKDILLGGEREGVKIPGFDYGNSPLEYKPEVVKDKIIILTTTNGTKAIRYAANRDAKNILIGSLLNARAVALEIMRLERDAVMICAGTNESFSLEDTIAAGVVIRKIEQCMKVILPDLANAASRLALSYRNNFLQALYDSWHGKKLLQLDCENDLIYCSQLNLFSFVPVYQQGIIILPEKGSVKFQ